MRIFSDPDTKHMNTVPGNDDICMGLPLRRGYARAKRPARRSFR